jgi:hypothetical protein
MRHSFTLAGAAVLALVACSGLGEANAKSRAHYRTYTERTEILWIPASRLHIRDKRVPKTLV